MKTNLAIALNVARKLQNFAFETVLQRPFALIVRIESAFCDDMALDFYATLICHWHISVMSEYVIVDGLKLREKVRAIITDTNGRVLLIRPHGYDDNSWTLAGGGVEKNESPYQAMLRELAEELSLAPALSVWPLLVSNRFIYSQDYKQKRRLDHDGQNATMFACSVRPDVELTLQAEEVADARWFAVDEAINAFPVAKQRSIFQSCIEEIQRTSSTQF